MTEKLRQKNNVSDARKLVVANLSKSFGSTPILKDVSFEIEEGEFVCFLGPSGCGKTTLLLCLAGLESPSAGEIYKNGQTITAAPPSQRDVGIVFQSYALFPNLSVFDNIAFGLVNLKWAKDRIREAVGGLVSLLSLEGHESKYPSQLSGGQQQRVALARALAVSPSLLLLDEPLSALDAQVRTRLRGEIRDLQQRLKITTVMVTHDQEEAQTLADRIVLMNAGRIEQIGTPWQIYNEPATPFVADFMGVSNLLLGVVSAQDEVACDQFALRCNTQHHPVGTKVQLLLRPEDIAVVAPTGRSEQAPTNLLKATIVKIEHLGAVVRTHVVNPSGLKLKVDISKRDFDPVRHGVSQELSVTIAPTDIRLFTE